jgi:TonB family protein
MDHATRRPMLAAAILSAALHAAALALVLASLEMPMEERRSLSVEVAWEQGAGGGAAAESGTMALATAHAGSISASESAERSPSMSPSGLTRGPSPVVEASAVSAADPGSSDQVRGRQSEVSSEAPAQDARGEIKVGADLRSAPTRSRNSEQRLASARPSSPAFLTLSADLTLRQAQDEVGSRRARKREKEPEPQRSEPSPACGRGQGEGDAACAVASESSATAQHAARPTDAARADSDTAVADRSDAVSTTASAVSTGAGGTAAGAPLASEGDIVQRSPPAYPLTARRQGLQGTAMVRARFDATGRPEHVAVVASSGSTSLDEAAREAVRRWRFRAGSAGVLDMPITFRLDGRERGDVAAAGG